MLLFCVKIIMKESRKFEQAHLKKKEEEEEEEGDFLIWYFPDVFSYHWVCCSSLIHLNIIFRVL